MAQAIVTDGKQDSSDLTFRTGFPTDNVSNMSVFEAFHQFREDYGQAPANTLRLWYASMPAKLQARH